MLVQYHRRKQRGYGLPYYQGMQVQRGRGLGGVLSGLFRNVFLPTAKNVGKNLLKYGAKKAAGVLQGVSDGKHLRQAVVDEFIPRPRSQPPIPKRTNKRKSAVTKSHRPIPPKRQKRRRRPTDGPRDIFTG